MATRIVCLTGESTIFATQERIRGYSPALDFAGLPSTLDNFAKDYSSAEYRQALFKI